MIPLLSQRRLQIKPNKWQKFSNENWFLSSNFILPLPIIRMATQYLAYTKKAIITTDVWKIFLSFLSIYWTWFSSGLVKITYKTLKGQRNWRSSFGIFAAKWKLSGPFNGAIKTSTELRMERWRYSPNTERKGKKSRRKEKRHIHVRMVNAFHLPLGKMSAENV